MNLPDAADVAVVGRGAAEVNAGGAAGGGADNLVTAAACGGAGELSIFGGAMLAVSLAVAWLSGGLRGGAGLFSAAEGAGAGAPVLG